MVYVASFNSISVISHRPVHLLVLSLSHGSDSGRTFKPILDHTVKTVPSIHVGQKFEDYQAFESAKERYQSAESAVLQEGF